MLPSYLSESAAAAGSAAAGCCSLVAVAAVLPLAAFGVGIGRWTRSNCIALLFWDYVMLCYAMLGCFQILYIILSVCYFKRL